MKKFLNLLILSCVTIFLSLPATLNAGTGKENASENTPTKKQKHKKPVDISVVKEIAKKISKLKHTKNGFKNKEQANKLLNRAKESGYIKLEYMFHKSSKVTLDKRTKETKNLSKNLFENDQTIEEEIEKTEKIDETWFMEETNNCNPNSLMPDRKFNDFDPDQDDGSGFGFGSDSDSNSPIVA